MPINTPRIDIGNPKPVEEMSPQEMRLEIEARGYQVPSRWDVYSTDSRRDYLRGVRGGLEAKSFTTRPPLNPEDLSTPGSDIATNTKKSTT